MANCPELISVTIGNTTYPAGNISFSDIVTLRTFFNGLGFGTVVINDFPTYLSVKISRPSSAFRYITICRDVNQSPCIPENISFDTSNCDPVSPVPVRVIPDPVKDFFQVKESQCDINVIQRFANAYWSKIKELKFGITDCCKDFNYETLWADKQISDLEQLLITGYTCREVPSIVTCCPWLPLQSCNLLPDPSGGTSILGIAGEALFLGALVMLGTDGKLYLNDPSDTTTYQRCVGFTMQSAVTNQSVKVLITGHITDTSWALSTGSIYYAGALGAITTSIPSSGISQMVGVAQSSSTLIIDIKQPVILT